MSRGRSILLYALFVATGVARAQQLPPQEPGSAPPKADSLPPKETDSLPPKEGDSPPSLDQLPPQEDKAKTKDEEYAFNPVKSKKAVDIGDFYFKKGDARAAASRYLEATKWNDGNAEAWLKLGEAEEKMSDARAARAAWEKYLKLAPQGKNAASVKSRMEKLK